MKQVTLKNPIDAHLHVRQEKTLATTVPLAASQFAQAIIMPNPKPPIQTAEDVLRYKQEILEHVPKGNHFEPLMTFKILPETDPDQVDRLVPASVGVRCQSLVISGKIYPKGLTTHAEDGVDDFFALWPVFEKMQELDIPVCLHGEMPGDHIEGPDREREFLRTLKLIVRSFPDLRIVMEHITTDAAVDAILSLPANVAATITAHHLMITCDDVGVDRMQPHNYCKPVAKKKADRAALIYAATSGCPKFFFGSDSAPHDKHSKECDGPCAGVFSAPILLQCLAQTFAEHNALDRLQRFACDNAKAFYRIIRYTSTPNLVVTLWNSPMVVPSIIDGFVPFMAEQKLSWSIKNEP